MAQSSLPAFSPFSFPQPLIQQLLGHVIDRVDAILAESELGFCDHQSPESFYGACDGGFPCHERATVHHLELGSEFCLKHFIEQENN